MTVTTPATPPATDDRLDASVAALAATGAASAETAPPADLVTVVVNWNTVDLLDDCLASIEAATPPGVRNEVIVVDNASTDGSVEHLWRAWPEVRVLVNDENEGFCRANNRAIRVSDAPEILLVNTDARLTPGSLDRLRARLHGDPRAAVVGPRLVYGDGSFQRWTAGGELSLRTFANHFLGLDRFAPRHPVLGGIYLADDTDEAFRPGWVSSAVMLLRRSALDEIGLLDERIFVYMDDVDLCQRALDGGWHIWYEPTATAVHFMGASSNRVTGRASPEALRSLNRWYARRHGAAAGTALRGIEAVGFGARAAAYAATGVARRDPDRRRQAAAHFAHLKLSLEPIHV